MISRNILIIDERLDIIVFACNGKRTAIKRCKVNDNVNAADKNEQT